jgi:DeoR/GlpR family transcriptional regulator of sugar metabolism
MIDAGSTTIQLARFLAFSEAKVTVVTNCLQVAMTLGQARAVTVILCPGSYLSEEGAVVGPETVDFIDRHYVDRCFLGAAGLSERGVTEAVPGFDAVKKAMMRRSRSRHFLIDASKFGRTHLNLVAPLAEIGAIVTDVRADAAILAKLSEAGVSVRVA